MRSLTLNIAPLLAHHEDHLSLWWPRHPIVVYCHLPFLAMLGAIYATTAMTLGQTLTFLVMGTLYVSSAAYHTWRPNRWLRTVDQTMISWFIVTTPLPWLYQHQWFVMLWLTLFAVTAVGKWYRLERSWGQEKITFFALGALSTLLVFTVGLPETGTPPVSATGGLVALSVLLYIGKLLTYHFQWRLIPKYLEAPELGHWQCGMATTVFAFVIAGVPA